MLRGMVFVDHMNFDIAVNSLYGGTLPKLDYNTLFKGIVELIPLDKPFLDKHMRPESSTNDQLTL